MQADLVNPPQPHLHLHLDFHLHPLVRSLTKEAPTMKSLITIKPEL